MMPTFEEPPLPEATKRQVARDMLVFQAKLFVDGLKDVLMSPLSLLAGLAGILLSRGNPGAPLYELMRLGKRIETWVNLFGAALPAQPTDQTTGKTDSTAQEADELATKENPDPLVTHEESPVTPASPRDFDDLVNRLQATLLDPKARSRLSTQSKEQLDQVTRRLLGHQPSDPD